MTELNPKEFPIIGLTMFQGRPRSRIEDVGQKAVQDGDIGNRMVFFNPHHIDDKGDDISPTGQCNPCDHVESNPESPGKFLRKVGHRSQTFAETDDKNDHPQEDDGNGDHIERSEVGGFRFDFRNHEFDKADDLFG